MGGSADATGGTRPGTPGRDGSGGPADRHHRRGGWRPALRLTAPRATCSIRSRRHLVALGGVVRLIGVQRRRSQAWWGVFLCAFVGMGSYVAFDVLDLDGSDLPNRLFGNAIAEEASQAETERLLHPAPSTPEAPGPTSLLLALRSVPESPQLIPCTTSATCVARFGQIRPRAHVSRATPSATPSTEDPA